MTTARRVGLLGAGYIADWHVRALRTVPGARVVAVCDQNRDRAEGLAARCGAARAETDLAALLKAGDVDVVHVLLPPTAHAAAARAVTDAGLPVYIEKPLCVTPADAAELAAREAAGGRIGVGHNFLFDRCYERLKADLAAGRLGRVEHVRTVWAKEFGPARAGPYGGWVFRNPANILLEVGPHPVAHLIDLLGGPPDRVQAIPLDPVRLPNGGVFYRRWLAWAVRGRVSAEVLIAVGGGLPEHRVAVRGSAGAAAVDYELGTYHLDRRTHQPVDFDRYTRTTRLAAGLARQARRNLAGYVLSKARLSRGGNSFGASVAAGVRQFYAQLAGGPADPRLSARFAADVVTTCLDLARAAGADPADVPAAPPAVGRPGGPADVLVLGGTGFIGRALVRRLAADGRRVRALVRDPAGIPAELAAKGVQVVPGDLGTPGDLAAAVAGVDRVVNLARSQSRTWGEYLRQDVDAARAVGEACVAARVRRLVYTGTTDSYYSGDDQVITEDTPLDPRLHRRNLYAQAKARAEAALTDLARTAGLPLVVARPAIVIGPGADPHHWGVAFWPAADACRYWGAGDNPLPLVLVDDVADALARCLDRDEATGQVFNLAADPGVSARRYVAALSDALATWIDARPTPTWRYFAADLAKYGVKWAVRHPERRPPSYRDWKSRTYRARFDCSKASRVLGWRPVSDPDALVEQGVRAAAGVWSG
ncbi:MAG: NAD-dependent epimerase/dehydratase family protein [Gemmataceae bacterium]